MLLLDVRGSEEAADEPYFEVLPENYLLIPLPALSVLPADELAGKIAEARARLGWQSGDIRIVTLCHSGRRSEMACPYFSKLGLSVESLDGGYGAWMMESD
jgi:rhodanese-related sulfurtransferase